MRAFVGRTRELAELDAGLGDAAAGRGRLFLLVGEPGIGKTRLADEVSQLASQRGFRVAWGRCWESGGAPAYWPWTQALEALIRNRSAEQIRRLVGAGGADIAQIVTSLRSTLPDLAERTASNSESRFQLHASVLGFLKNIAAEAPVTLVLDDLHAADLSSLALLQLVARELRSTELLVVGTYRDVEARLTAEVAKTLAQIARDARVLELARLGPDETRELLVPAGADEQLVATVFQASQGNPLFADELARLLRARGTQNPVELPDGVREVIRGRLGLLSDSARSTLSIASVLGVEFGARVLAELANTDELARAALAEGKRAGVVVERDDSHWAFSHVLYRDTLYSELERDKRLELHRAVANQLAGTPKGRLSELAHHWREAGDVERAVSAATGAAEWAFERQAYEDAVALLERAAEQPALSELDAEVRYELELGLGRARIGAGRAALGTANCVAAADIARSLGDPERLARAALGYGLLLTPGSVDSTLVALLEEALERLGSARPALRACVMARLAGAIQPTLDVNEPMRLAREALQLARGVADPATMATVLFGAGSALAVHAPPEERVDLGLEHERLATALGNRTQLLRARRRLVFAYLELADLAQADRMIDAYETVARDLGQANELWPAPLMRAARAAMHGRFSEADALYEQASRLAEGGDAQDAPATLAQHRLCRLLLQERHADLLAYLPQMRARLSGISSGEGQAAINEMLVRARLGLPIEPTPMTQYLLFAAHAPIETAASLNFAEIAMALGPTAELILPHYEHWVPWGARLMCWGVFSMACEGPVAGFLAGVARWLGRRSEALQQFECATRQADRLELRPSAAKIRCDWAEALIDGGTPAETAEARALLAHARETAIALDMMSLVERIDAVVEKLPAALAPRADTPFELSAEGEVWTVRFGESIFRLKDSKGVQTLARLVNDPGRELHVLELVGGGDRPVRDSGDTSELLDSRAVDAYRSRLEDLAHAIEEAESFGDGERAARARAEREQIANEIARSVGLGGRSRRFGSAAERARTAIQRRLKDAIERIGEHSPALREHLESSIRTGTFCSYRPTVAVKRER